MLLSRCSDDAEESTDVNNGLPGLTSLLAKAIRIGSGDLGISPFTNHLGEIAMADWAWGRGGTLQATQVQKQPVVTYG